MVVRFLGRIPWIYRAPKLAVTTVGLIYTFFVAIGTCSVDLYLLYLFETSGTASCGTTGIHFV